MEKKSIGIVIVLIIAIVVIIFVFFQSFKDVEIEEEITIEEKELTYPEIAPSVVVQEFYDWYLSDENALPSENYKTNEILTERFKNAVSEQINEGPLNIDPFICSAELPLSIHTDIGTAEINKRRANVTVDSLLSDVEMISFIAELDLTDDDKAWKINNVVCFIKGI